MVDAFAAGTDACWNENVSGGKTMIGDNQEKVFSAIFTSKFYVRPSKEEKITRTLSFLWENDFPLKFKNWYTITDQQVPILTLTESWLNS